jgi:hypothetical protein
MRLFSIPDMERFQNPKAEETRLRALYRDYVYKKNVRLPINALKALIGPDCAYHLYKLTRDPNRKP